MSRIFPVIFRPAVLAMAFTLLTANLIAQEPAKESNNRQLLLPSPDIEIKAVSYTHLTLPTTPYV